jgi:hypothetical protein
MSVNNELAGRLALITGASGGYVLSLASTRPRFADEVYAALVVPVHAIYTPMASISR